MYRKIMLFHNIMVEDKNRLAREVLAQQITDGHEESFANQVREEAAVLSIADITELTKSQLKKTIKDEIRSRMQNEIAVEVNANSKLRFLSKRDQYERAEYVNEMAGDEVLEILKIRLNMMDIHGNYKTDLTKKRLCPHCTRHKDTTEHLITCSAVESKENWEEKDLGRTDAESWKGLLDTVRRNIGTR